MNPYRQCFEPSGLFCDEGCKKYNTKLFGIFTQYLNFKLLDSWFITIFLHVVMFMTSDFLNLHTLGILNHSQPNGLAVPDASMQPVKSTADVIRLMDIGHKNRAKGATAMNERSSRSHRSFLSLYPRHSTLKFF